MIVALIPAHNEEENISSAIDSLRDQTRQPDRIIVVADNCTDRTASIAVSMGVEVSATINNVDKKAGALNLLFKEILNSENLYLVMDADTSISKKFLEVAESRLDNNKIGAIGGLFYGEPGHGLLGVLQRNEYARYSRTMAIDESKTMVLSGTASLFRGDALREVSELRGTELPGTNGSVYDTHALTEDNELTIALKTLGWKMVSPQECNNVTEVMTTWPDLWKQRKRWQRGAIENLKMYGMTKITKKYWLQQFGIAYGVLSFALLSALAVTVLLSVSDYKIYPFWIGITGVFIADRVWTVWKMGWKSRLVASVLIVEMVYDLFIQAVFVRSVIDSALNKEEHWKAPKRKQPVTFMTSITILLGGVLLLNLGQYPQILDTFAFQALAVFVMFNTMFFALWGATKLTHRH